MYANISNKTKDWALVHERERLFSIKHKNATYEIRKILEFSFNNLSLPTDMKIRNSIQGHYSTYCNKNHHTMY